MFWIVGEISNFRIPVSGHFYFTLKDEAAQINAVMFRGQQRQLKFEPEDGMRITAMGRLSVYEPRGTYQIILEYMEPAGVGALQIAYEKLKARLAEDGLFDDKYKQPLPFLPQKIAPDDVTIRCRGSRYAQHYRSALSEYEHSDFSRQSSRRRCRR